MNELIAKHAHDINGVLANKLGVGPYSLCFCGSGKKFKFCCQNKSGEQIVFLKNAIESAVRFRDSQGGEIDRIPLGIFNQFRETSTSRLKCLYPGCGKSPALCHSIPENILRQNFGAHCQEFGLQDGLSGGTFRKTGVSKAGALEVFCPDHDCGLFKSIDPLEIDLKDKKQLFLLAFKTIAFSLRRTQCYLGIDCQAEVIKPILISKKIGNSTQKATIELDISNFHIQYIRFCTAHAIFEKYVSAYEKSNWDFLSHWSRSIENGEKIFFAGFLNPSHDLAGKRLNSSKTPINMTCNIFATDTGLNAVFSCSDGASKNAYTGLFEQILKSDEQVFVNVLNSIMTVSSEKPLVSENFAIENEETQKIRIMNDRAIQALNSSNNDVLNFKDIDQAIAFIE